MSQKRARSASPECFFRSSPIEDRSSKFIAFYSPSLSAKELQAQSELHSATHRIAAWRKPSNQCALSSELLFDIGHDDDGEKYGGKSLEKVLASMDVEGAVVVARWYGGVMLGPARFDHIKACASEAILQWRRESERANKKAKVEIDEQDRDRLVQVLGERDQSITVLRGLLAEKKRQPSSHTDASNTDIAAKVPDYANMPLPALMRLERVRDATIGWILKQIEKAEEVEQTRHSRLDTATAPPSAKSEYSSEG
ncbi:hypothetical protein MMC28_001855 [Mycoblastus sanguinarius]|nr:hypothetical protein [Mycoblastus sanguinarius]